MNQKEAQEEIDRIIHFLKTTFAETGFSLAVIGVSGGVDSAVCLALISLALGKENVSPLLLPYGNLNTRGVLDTMTIIEALGIPLNHVQRMDIKPIVDAICAKEAGMDQIRKGNIIARVRMIELFDQAKKRNALVVGTENKSEHLLGYFTRFGDEASDVEPIIHLYKTGVYALGKELHIPQAILEKAPTAGLWVEQTDEKELGFSYKDADPILEQLIDQKKSADDIVQSGFERLLVEKVQNQMEKNAFKHKTPYSMV